MIVFLQLAKIIIFRQSNYQKQTETPSFFVTLHFEF